MTEPIVAVQKMQDYIKQHFGEEITLADLSKVSSYSPWHCYRLFRDCVGVTPAEYIRRIRLSKSAIRLKNEKVKIIDVAFDSGFGSADGYTRAFYREFGMTPIEYARNPVPITLFIPYRVELKDKKKEKSDMSDVKNVFIQVVRKPKRKVIIKRGIKANEYWGYCNEVGCDVWGILMSMDSLCGEPVCLWLPSKFIKPNTSMYVQGVEVNADFNGIVPEGFDVITLPESEYLMFQGEPFNEEEYCEAIEMVQNSMKKYDPSVIGYKWNEENSPRIQLEPRGDRGYIELRAIIRTTDG